MLASLPVLLSPSYVICFAFSLLPPPHTRCLLCAGIFLQRMGYGCMVVGIRMRAALISAVCQKSFKMASINRDDAADVVSFVASDISKVSHYWGAALFLLCECCLKAVLMFFLMSGLTKGSQLAAIDDVHMHFTCMVGVATKPYPEPSYLPFPFLTQQCAPRPAAAC